MHHAEDQHQHRRHQVDGDGAGPARDEIAGIAQHRFGGGQRLEAAGLDRRHIENLRRRRRQRRGLRGDRAFDAADHAGLALAKVAASGRGRRDEPRCKAVSGALHRRRDRGLLQGCNHTHQRHRFGPERIAAVIDRAAG